MPPEFPRSVEIVPKLAEGALAALDRGDRAEHDRLVVEASRDLRDCDLIALAQYSMAPAAAMVADATGRPVLTTPDSAVLKLKQLLARVNCESRICDAADAYRCTVLRACGPLGHRHALRAQNKLPCPSSSDAAAALRARLLRRLRFFRRASAPP